MNIQRNDVILTTKGQRKKSKKGGWKMIVIEAQSDIEGGFVVRGKRVLKSGIVGRDFMVRSDQIKLEQ